MKAEGMQVRRGVNRNDETNPALAAYRVALMENAEETFAAFSLQSIN